MCLCVCLLLETVARTVVGFFADIYPSLKWFGCYCLHVAFVVATLFVP